MSKVELVIEKLNNKQRKTLETLKADCKKTFANGDYRAFTFEKGKIYGYLNALVEAGQFKEAETRLLYIYYTMS